MSRLTREQAQGLVECLEMLTKSYAGSDVAIQDDLEYWLNGEGNGWRDPDMARDSRKAIEAALPEMRKAARRILDLLGEP